MKIRNGFVSNSSSSSYVVRLPKDFDVDKFDLKKALDKAKYTNYEESMSYANEKEVMKAINLLLKRRWVNTMFDGRNVVGVVQLALDPFVVKTIPGGSEEEWFILLE